MKRWNPSLWICLVATSIMLSACGGGTSDPRPTLATSSDIQAAETKQGVSPFIAFLQVRGASLKSAESIRYTIAAKSGAVSKPVSVQYTMDSLRRRGFAIVGGDFVALPVVGLYSGYENDVAIQITFDDSSVQTLSKKILTPTYTDLSGIYDKVNVLKRRDAGTAVGFDFFVVKSGLGSPLIIDTDGDIRWVAAGVPDGFSSTFYQGGFVIGERGTTRVNKLELDGSISSAFVISPTYTNFHHNIDAGKQGLLAEMDSKEAGIANIETIIAEITATGAVLKEWNFTTLLRSYMLSQGDNPDTFIRPGIDWLHINGSTYDPRDDSLIVSSRENFVFKVDYRTGDLIWILGDPTKYWYTFPSLRAKALTLDAGGLYPIGQHAPSITSDGLLMLFNNGFPSLNQPSGAAVGESRGYSAVSAYSIDPVTHTAREVWRFDNGQTISSTICSSTYEAPGKTYLVNYAVAANRTKARIVGLNSSREVVFDFEYGNTAGCQTSWNAVPFAFDNLEIN